MRAEFTVHAWVHAQSDLTLRDPTACSPPDSSVHGISQARILNVFPPPGDLPNQGMEPASPESPALAGGFFSIMPPQ